MHYSLPGDCKWYCEGVAEAPR